MSSRVVRDGSSAVISGAWAWWPITPCMNRVGGVGPDPHDVNGLRRDGDARRFSRRAGLHEGWGSSLTVRHDASRIAARRATGGRSHEC